MDLKMFQDFCLKQMLCYSLLVLLCLSQIVHSETNSTTTGSDDINSTVPPSLITCYKCESHLEEAGTCAGIERRRNNVTQVDCPWPNNACMMISTVRFQVGPSGDYETSSSLTERLCGTREGGDDCDKTDGAQSLTMECFCKQDLCNSGHVIVTSLTTCLVLVLAGLFCRLA